MTSSPPMREAPRRPYLGNSAANPLGSAEPDS